MVFNGLLNFRLNFRCDATSRDLFKQLALSRRQVLTELSLPFGDLLDGDRIQLQGIQLVSLQVTNGARTRPLTPA
jgi:hypothetical protein